MSQGISLGVRLDWRGGSGPPSFGATGPSARIRPSTAACWPSPRSNPLGLRQIGVVRRCRCQSPAMFAPLRGQANPCPLFARSTARPWVALDPGVDRPSGRRETRSSEPAACGVPWNRIPRVAGAVCRASGRAEHHGPNRRHPTNVKIAQTDETTMTSTVKDAPTNRPGDFIVSARIPNAWHSRASTNAKPST